MTLSYFDGIRYGEFADIEALIDPATREIWVAQAAIERMLNLRENSAREKLASKSFNAFADYLNIDIETKVVDAARKNGRTCKVVVVSVKTFEVFAAWVYRKHQNLVAFDALSEQSKLYAAHYDHFIKTCKQAGKQSTQKCDERLIQEKLSIRLGGETEVVTPVGRIDILTSTEIIEIKSAHLWKSALGQVLAYGYYFPSHRKRIHLYGSMHSSSKVDAKAICQEYGVTISWE